MSSLQRMTLEIERTLPLTIVKIKLFIRFEENYYKQAEGPGVARGKKKFEKNMLKKNFQKKKNFGFI